MKQQAVENTPTWLYYYPLLLHYATRIIKDQDTAAVLVKRVMYAQYSIDGLQKTTTTRHILKADTLNSCKLYQQLQIFDCSPVKLPFK
ncbi:hypothetical protein [Ferruginibacter sp. SUN106]|uniref:hypothetical protein n=1 Tax=Ferruginibacter sp. SUN106 TaxID=2978348 RepID=UPI003D3660AC